MHSEYFYITKTQAIDENFVIKNYISEEDEARIKELVQRSKDHAYDEDEDDSDYGENKDHFEEALEYMRHNREFNIGIVHPIYYE